MAHWVNPEVKSRYQDILFQAVPVYLCLGFRGQTLQEKVGHLFFTQIRSQIEVVYHRYRMLSPFRTLTTAIRRKLPRRWKRHANNSSIIYNDDLLCYLSQTHIKTSCKFFI